jgi:hypothetical protein
MGDNIIIHYLYIICYMSLRLITITLMVLVMVMAAGCVDLLTNREVLTEASWLGRVTDVNGSGIANATVTLHVLGPGGEIYSRQAQSASSEPLRGIYAFEHIELRGGADHAYTTCNVTWDGRTMTGTGEIKPLADRSRASTITVNGKNITAITYGGAVDERLILR